MAGAFTNIFKSIFPSKIVGVDLGNYSVKVVEISGFAGKYRLENYGELSSEVIYGEPLKPGTVHSKDLVSKALKTILDESRIKTKGAIFSIPDFSTFFTSFEIPPMTKQEIPSAIQYGASQYITLPISEVILDWQVVPINPADKNSAMKVFLVAVPNSVVQDYKDIAKSCGLELHAIEAEVLGLVRSLVKNSKKTICLVDIGEQTSTLSIVNNGILKRSYSFDLGSTKVTQAIVSSGVDSILAKDLKIKEGLLSTNSSLKNALEVLFEPLLAEVKTISDNFLEAEKKSVEEIYLTGGAAALPGLKEHFEKNLQKTTFVSNCFSGFSYPATLDSTIKEMAPRFSVAVGVALGGL